MWVFGYGSLMGDKWEDKFGCARRCIAVLRGYRRTFNKASTKNWGTKETPCPTLNLEKADDGECTGIGLNFLILKRRLFASTSLIWRARVSPFN